jgi:hypothetical protein
MEELSELEREYENAKMETRAAKDRYIAIRTNQIREFRTAQELLENPPKPKVCEPPKVAEKVLVVRKSSGKQILVGPFPHPISAAKIRSMVAKFGKIATIEVKEKEHSAIVTFEKKECVEGACAVMKSGDPRYEKFRISRYPKEKDKVRQRNDELESKEVALTRAFSDTTVALVSIESKNEEQPNVEQEVIAFGFSDSESAESHEQPVEGGHVTQDEDG